MLKFHCASCDKKIGVPDNYAGKRVKCPGCGTAVRAPEAEPVAAETGGGGGMVDLNALSALEEGAQAQTVERSAADFSGARCPNCDARIGETAVICISCGHHLKKGKNVQAIAGEKRAKREKGKAAVNAAAAGAGGLMGALIGSSIGAAVGAAIWAAVIFISGYEIGYIAIVVGACAGGGLKIFTDERNPLVALIGAGAAIVGIAAGKYVIAVMVANNEPDITTEEAFKMMWGGMDLLFLGLAAAVAGGMGLGSEGEE